MLEKHKKHPKPEVPIKAFPAAVLLRRTLGLTKRHSDKAVLAKVRELATTNARHVAQAVALEHRNRKLLDILRWMPGENVLTAAQRLRDKVDAIETPAGEPFMGESLFRRMLDKTIEALGGEASFGKNETVADAAKRIKILADQERPTFSKPRTPELDALEAATTLARIYVQGNAKVMKGDKEEAHVERILGEALFTIRRAVAVSVVAIVPTDGPPGTKRLDQVGQAVGDTQNLVLLHRALRTQRELLAKELCTGGDLSSFRVQAIDALADSREIPK